MKFNCRIIVPFIGQWAEMEGENPHEALINYYEQEVKHLSPGINYRHVTDDNNIQYVHFWLAEVENSTEQLAFRLFSSGIYRRGGVAPKNPITLKDVADRLGWTHNPEDLLSSGWENEQESWV